MATSDSRERQTRLSGTFPTLEFERGDLLEPTPGAGHRVQLSECPLCAADPTRPRYRFGAGESRPEHFERAHGPGDV